MKAPVKKSSSKNNSKKSKKVQKSKKSQKSRLALKTKDQKVKFIRSGSVLEKVNEYWTSLTPAKRKILAEVGNALTTNDRSDTKRIRNSLLPKLVKVKKPMTGYMLFVHENHQKYKTKHPTSKMTELAKMLGQQWKLLSLEEQTAYKSRHA